MSAIRIFAQTAKRGGRRLDWQHRGSGECLGAQPSVFADIGGGAFLGPGGRGRTGNQANIVERSTAGDGVMMRRAGAAKIGRGLHGRTFRRKGNDQPRLAVGCPAGVPFNDGFDAFCFGGSGFFGLRVSRLPRCCPLAMILLPENEGRDDAGSPVAKPARGAVMAEDQHANLRVRAGA